MTPQKIEALFTRPDGRYAFARWGRPIAPVVFGVEDQTLAVVKGAFEAVVALAGHKMAQSDPELGANAMVFFLREWEELLAVPDLNRLIPDIDKLVPRLVEAEANQYRIFRVDEQGAIMAAFVFLRMDDAMQAESAEGLALAQVVQVMLLWSDAAFRDRSPLALAKGQLILRPEIAGLIRAAYDPVMPASAQDASHALRLFARMEQPAHMEQPARLEQPE